MLKPTPKDKRKSLERQISRIVLVGSLVFLPVYFAVRFTGGSVKKLEELPDFISRLQTPVVWEVPEGGVKYLHFFHAPPDSGDKFVLIDLRLQARLKLGYPIVPKCFQLVDDENRRYYPLSRSPLFIERGAEFRMDRDESLEGELLFEIPLERKSARLTFERYQE